MWGSSFSVQWLGCGAFTAVTCSQSLVGELGSSKLRDEAKQYIKLEILTWLISRLVPEAELWAQSSLSSSGLNDSVLEIQTWWTWYLTEDKFKGFSQSLKRETQMISTPAFVCRFPFGTKKASSVVWRPACTSCLTWWSWTSPPPPPRNALVSARRQWGADGHCLPLGRYIWVTLQTLPPAVQDWFDLDDSEQWPSSSFCIMSGVVDGIWLGWLWEH